MGAILPLNFMHIDEPQVRLVDERGGLQAMFGPFTPHVARCASVQFLVHKWQQRV
jgi:hypothetical protein